MSTMGGRFPGMRVLDLFAGSGALGLECLSRGAEHVTFVERAPASLKVLRRNIDLLGAADRCSVVQGDVFSWITTVARGPEQRADVALADPPYAGGLAARLVETFAEDPFATSLWVEHASSDVIPQVPGLRQRRYGDTTLSRVDADA
jgi:16S rRNA (guanine966-N2)-methyltransferase